MKELFQFKWQTFDPLAAVKVSSGLVVMLLLAEVTGEPWLTTALVALFAWIANVPGPLKERVAGMAKFAAAAVVLTLVYGQLGLELWPNVIAIAALGFLGTLVLIRGTRAFVVGYALICWGIYGPLMVAGTSVLNCVLAIVVGTGVVILLNVVGEMLQKNASQVAAKEPAETAAGPDLSFVLLYSMTVAAMLSVTYYYGRIELQTDPTLMIGGAFFVLGFDIRKTWVAGLGRALGLFAGVLVGLWLSQTLGPGWLTTVLMIAAAGLSFGAIGVHSGAWMFFFTVFAAMGWAGLDPAALELTVNERFYGELSGVAAAMVAIVLLHWLQNRSTNSGNQ